MTSTHWSLLTLTVVLASWDIYLAISPPKGDTISEVIRSVGRKYLIIPFAFGVLIGHWFWHS